MIEKLKTAKGTIERSCEQRLPLDSGHMSLGQTRCRTVKPRRVRKFGDLSFWSAAVAQTGCQEVGNLPRVTSCRHPPATPLGPCAVSLGFVPRMPFLSRKH